MGLPNRMAPAEASPKINFLRCAAKREKPILFQPRKIRWRWLATAHKWILAGHLAMKNLGYPSPNQLPLSTRIVASATGTAPANVSIETTKENQFMKNISLLFSLVILCALA